MLECSIQSALKIGAGFLKESLRIARKCDRVHQRSIFPPKVFHIRPLSACEFTLRFAVPGCKTRYADQFLGCISALTILKIRKEVICRSEAFIRKPIDAMTELLAKLVR